MEADQRTCRMPGADLVGVQHRVPFASDSFEAVGRRLGPACPFCFAGLAGIHAGQEQLARCSVLFPSRLQPRLGIRAHGQQLLFSREPVLEAPPLAARRGDLEIQPGSITEPESLVRRNSGADLRVGKHGGRQLQLGVTAFCMTPVTPKVTPSAAAYLGVPLSANGHQMTPKFCLSC